MMLSTVTTAARTKGVEGPTREERTRPGASVLTLARRGEAEGVAHAAPSGDAVGEIADRIVTDRSMTERLWLVVGPTLGGAIAARMDVDICRAAADARIAAAGIRIAAL